MQEYWINIPRTKNKQSDHLPSGEGLQEDMDQNLLINKSQWLLNICNCIINEGKGFHNPATTNVFLLLAITT